MSENLRATIKPKARIRAHIRYIDRVDTSVTEPYEGQYTVTPALVAQTLQTKKKKMLENVTVKEIPVSVVSNAAGGNTVIIG